ncbi:hypothetical protein F5148DRAFT_1375995 [Russula earlei]|uniref:Uncharacterized protein n=1 Tax=Russula earlei TaxID=71964 RepID=A0ACC0U938_9AGAM|nr:hypothetical protein F5148DRAFT_1375995 [Russula earlei]
MMLTDQSILDRATINRLPDDVLVEIFHSYVNHSGIGTNGWHTLVHVCQNWRYIVFASPHRLNLRLLYTGKRPVSEIQDVWPTLPVVIIHGLNLSKSWGNIAAALESDHHDRICEIDLFLIPTSEWERLAAAMQKPFPELTLLRFGVAENSATSLPDSLLGGSAPLLKELSLRNCLFPGIPKVILSANLLVVLNLWFIPDSCYISSRDLGTALSVTSGLETLRLRFQSPQYPESRPHPPLTRSVLPALTHLYFRGVHEYLEVLLAPIEAPLLNTIDVTFYMDLHFVLPQLHRLISHAEWFKTCDRAIVRTSDDAIQIAIFRDTIQYPELLLEIRCRHLDWQLASLAQICSSSFPLLSTFVQLNILDDAPQSHWKVDMETTTQWLDLLDPLTAVKDRRLSDQVARHVCQALEELADEKVTEVLPALQNIFLRGLGPLESVPEYIEGFVAARQLSGYPVAVHRWE